MLLPMHGLTLIELLVALAVGGILLTWTATGASHVIEQRRASAALNQILGALQFTRHAAVSHRATTTLCPSNGGGCGRRNSWHEGALIFLDRDGDGRLDGEDTALRRLPPLREEDRIYWRSFGNRKHLSIRPSGLTAWQSGNLTYCPPDGDLRYARQAIVNAQGRVRLARDADGDGIREDASGRDLRCP